MKNSNKRLIASFLALIMVIGNIAFNNTKAYAGDYTLMGNIKEIESSFFEGSDGKSNYELASSLVSSGSAGGLGDMIESDSGSSLDYYVSQDADPLSGTNITFTAHLNLSSQELAFNNSAIVMTIPEGIDVNSATLSDDNKNTFDYQKGSINGVNVIAVKLKDLNAGTALTFVWTAKFPTEQTTNGFKSDSHVYYVTNIFDNAAVDGDQTTLGYMKNSATARAKTENVVSVKKSIEANGEMPYEKVFDSISKRYLYNVVYKIDVVRDKAAFANGSLAIGSYTLEDVISKDASGADPVAVAFVDADGKALEQSDNRSYDAPTRKASLKFSGSDFTDLGTANPGDEYKLLNPVYIKVTYNQSTFESAGEEIKNIAYGEGKFVDGSDIGKAEGTVSFKVPDKSSFKYGFDITKTTKDGKSGSTSEPVQWTRVTENLPISFKLGMENKGDYILDEAVIVDSTIKIGDKVLTAGVDYTITNVQIPVVSGVYSAIKVYYKNTSDANDTNYTLATTSNSNITTKDGVQTFAPKTGTACYGIKISAENFMDRKSINGITLNTYILPKKLNVSASGTIPSETLTNYATGYYINNGTETGKVEKYASYLIRYKNVTDATLSKTVTTPTGGYKLSELRTDKDAEFTITYKNTTGYTVDKVTITDEEFKFFLNNVPVSGPTYTFKSLTVNNANSDSFISDDKKSFSFERENVSNDATITLRLVVTILNANSVTIDKITNKATAVTKFGNYEKTVDATADVTVNYAPSMKIEKDVDKKEIPVLDEIDGKLDGLYVSDQELTYTLTVTNDGESVIGGYTIIEKLNGAGSNIVFLNANGKKFGDLAAIKEVKLGDATYSNWSITDDVLTINGDGSLAIGGSKEYKVVVTLKKFNTFNSKDYTKISNNASLKYGVDSSNQDKTAQSITVYTLIKDLTTSATISKGFTLTSDDMELINNYAFKGISYKIVSNITTNVPLKTVTVEDNGLKFVDSMIGTPVSFPPGKQKMDYAWIDSVSIPNFFANGNTSGLSGYTGVKLYVEYKVADTDEWVRYNTDLHNDSLYENNVLTLTAVQLTSNASTKLAQVRLVFEEFPSNRGANGAAVEREITTSKYPFTINVTFGNLLELANSLGYSFKIKNDALISWTYYLGGGGIGGSSSITSGIAITIPSSNPITSLSKSTNNAAINYSSVKSGGGQIQYTLRYSNSGGPVQLAKIEDTGLKLITVKAAEETAVDYDKYYITGISVVIKGSSYAGGVSLYGKDTNGEYQLVEKKDHIVPGADKIATYVFNNVFKDEPGNENKQFYVLFGDEVNRVPRAFVADVLFTAKLSGNGELSEDATKFTNFANSTYVPVGETEFKGKVEGKANTAITKTLSGSVVKYVKDGSVWKTDSDRPEPRIELGDMLGTNVKDISYKISLENKSAVSANMILTDKTSVNNPTLYADKVMKLKNLYVPNGFGSVTVEKNSGANFVAVSPKAPQDAGVPTGYTQYVLGTDQFRVTIQNVAAGAKFDILADYEANTTYAYAKETQIQKIYNDASLQLKRTDSATVNYINYVTVYVDKDNMPLINQSISKKADIGTVNLSTIAKGDQKIVFTVDGIGHNKDSGRAMQDYVLTDEGLTIKNLVKDQDINVDDTTKYAYMQSVKFKAHEVTGLTLKIDYVTLSGISKEAQWKAHEDTVIDGGIKTFSAEAATLSKDFADKKIEITAVIKQIDQNADDATKALYGYDTSTGQYPDGSTEIDLFKVINNVRQEAENPYDVEKLSAKASADVLVKASKRPTLDVKKTAEISDFSKAAWYLADQTITYNLTNIKNDSLEMFDKFTVSDSGVKAFISDVDEFEAFDYTITDLRFEVVKSATPGSPSIEYRFDGADFESAVISNAGTASIQGADLGKTFDFIVYNLPVGWEVKASYDVKIKKAGSYEAIKDVIRLDNVVEITYEFGGNSFTNKSDISISTKGDGQQDFRIVKRVFDTDNKINAYVKEATVGSGTYVEWEIIAYNASNSASSVVINPVIWDILPGVFNDATTAFQVTADFGTVSGTINPVFVKNANDSRSISYLGTSEYNDPNKDYSQIRLDWKVNGDLKYLDAVRLTFKAKLVDNTEPVSATNNAYAEALNVSEVSDYATIKITNVSSLILIKEVSGGLDINQSGQSIFYRYPSVGTAQVGDIAYYRLSMANYSKQQAKNVVIADLLPYLSDFETGIATMNTSRGSKWVPTLDSIYDFGLYTVNLETGSDELLNNIDQSKYTIYLSETTSGTVIQAAMNADEATLLANGWVKYSDELNMAQYKSFIVKFADDIVIEQNQKIKLMLKVNTPNDPKVASSGLIAYNSMAGMQGTTGIVEPNKVGLKLVYSRLGDRVWVDEDKDGLQSLDNGNYLDKGYAGVKVYLYRVNDGVRENEPIAQAVTDKNGFYVFEHLKSGTYMIAFEKQDGFDFTNKSLTTESTYNSDVWVGQDKDQQEIKGKLYFTKEILLGVNTEDLTWDAGVIVIPTKEPTEDPTEQPSKGPSSPPAPSDWRKSEPPASSPPSEQPTSTPVPTPVPSEDTPIILEDGTNLIPTGEPDEFYVFDEDGTPLGTITLPPEISVSDLTYEDIADQVVPLGQRKVIPKTGDDISTVWCVVIALGALALIFFEVKERVNKKYIDTNK